MIELNVTKNTTSGSPGFNKWYPKAHIIKMLTLPELAKHMSEHNTPYSAGCIQGVLTDMVGCIRELTLQGYSVKIDNLAIFKLSVEGNGQPALYQGGANGYGSLKAAIGIGNSGTKQNPVYTGFAVKSLKLLSVATGDYSKDELNKEGSLGWTTEAQKKIQQAKDESE